MSNHESDRLKLIKLLVMDIDGTMTDSKVYYSSRGEEFKVFSIRDGMAIELLRKSGIDTAIITSESSEIVTSRAKKLKINTTILGSRNKKKDLLEVAKKLSLELAEIAYIGDDVNDLQPMQIAGCSACPSDAVDAIKSVANYVCSNPGGFGAVREFAELILKAQDRPVILPESW